MRRDCEVPGYLAKPWQIAHNPRACKRKSAPAPMLSVYQASKIMMRPQREKTTTDNLRGRVSGLGPLETKLLEVLWAQKCALTVHRLQLLFPARAYTTIMTTLDRLYRKGLLLRHKQGRAFAYEPQWGRDELLSELVSGHVMELLGGSAKSTVVLSTLVRAVRLRDAALLDELDALVQAERSRLQEQDK
jgi:predicted transcriptional regulator